VTQPSRPSGRGQRDQDPPVARWARERGLPVFQPEKVRRPEFLEEMRVLAPDVAVVVAFGQIFPRALLDLPPYGCLNVHASLLPRHRGAAPIQAAVAAGDARTGVTTMRMEEGLDTGPILLQEETAIGPEETAAELSLRLAEMGGPLMVRTLRELEAGTLAGRPQPTVGASGVTGVTYAPRLTRESGRVDWALSAQEIANRLRAYTPWPGLTTTLRGEPLKLVRAEPLADSLADSLAESVSEAAAPGTAPGTIVGLSGGLLKVAAGGGTALGVREVQRPGKKALSAADFVNGERLSSGESFS
jgi:methionyl-tRNA formyltransferase